MKLVKVYWRDIQTLEGGWLNHKEALIVAKKQYNIEFITVGFLIERNPHFVLIASTISPDGEHQDVSMIPRSVIIRTEKL